MNFQRESKKPMNVIKVRFRVWLGERFHCSGNRIATKSSHLVISTSCQFIFVTLVFVTCLLLVILNSNLNFQEVSVTNLWYIQYLLELKTLLLSH